MTESQDSLTSSQNSTASDTASDIIRPSGLNNKRQLSESPDIGSGIPAATNGDSPAPVLGMNGANSKRMRIVSDSEEDAGKSPEKKVQNLQTTSPPNKSLLGNNLSRQTYYRIDS